MNFAPYKRPLPVGLDHTGLAELAIEHATNQAELFRMQRAYKDEQNAWRERLREQEGVCKNLLDQVLDGAAIQPVDCVDEVDEDTWQLRTVRLDTAGVVEARDMTEEEIAHYKQQELELEDGGHRADKDDPPAQEIPAQDLPGVGDNKPDNVVALS